MGCILFQLVSGRVPFAADNFMGVLSMHLTETPPQIEPAVFDQIGAPRALAGVIDRALEKDRDKRWQTIDELANAVREVCGDPEPADRSDRIESVPAPASVTRSRPPTSQVLPGGARQRTEWTGDVKVPEVPVDEAPPQAPPKTPFLVAGAIGLVVVVAAVALTLRGGKSATQPAAGSAAGSAPAESTAAAGSAAASTPAAAAALPSQVHIHLGSVPPGAEVVDAASGAKLGVTPAELTLDGSTQPKAYRLHLRGFEDVTYEVTPDRADIRQSVTLVREAVAPVHAGHVAAHPAAGSASADSGSAGDVPVTHPDVPVTHPDMGSAAAGAAAAGSADDTEPHIKSVIPGLTGSGSGT
jgi:serine/threonine-protein kinase